MADLFSRHCPKIHSGFSPKADIVLFNGDCLKALSKVPDESFKLIITSPPYNIGKKYETVVSLESYLDGLAPVIKELVRTLKNDGSICWQVGNYVEDTEVFPLDMYFYPHFKKHNLQLRNRMIWHFEHGLHASKRFSGRYETLLWFTKSDNYTFNLDAVRVPHKYPGKTYYKGPKRGKPSCNPLGKNPSDYWTVVEQDWKSEIWNIPNVKSNHPEKTAHPCQFPIELVERCVLSLTNEGDWVLDPYSGVGSTAIGALIHERKTMCCEKDGEYVEITKKRIHAYYDGDLKIRPIGKSVHKPTGREKVSQIPLSWKLGGQGDAIR